MADALLIRNGVLVERAGSLIIVTDGESHEDCECCGVPCDCCGDNLLGVILTPSGYQPQNNLDDEDINERHYCNCTPVNASYLIPANPLSPCSGTKQFDNTFACPDPGHHPAGYTSLPIGLSWDIVCVPGIDFGHIDIQFYANVLTGLVGAIDPAGESTAKFYKEFINVPTPFDCTQLNGALDPYDLANWSQNMPNGCRVYEIDPVLGRVPLVGLTAEVLTA